MELSVQSSSLSSVVFRLHKAAVFCGKKAYRKWVLGLSDVPNMEKYVIA